jgi:hypothetical protein
MTTAADSSPFVPERSFTAYVALVARNGARVAPGWEPVTLKIQGHQFEGFARQEPGTVFTGISVMESALGGLPALLADSGMQTLNIKSDERTISVAMSGADLQALNTKVH